ncbi:suppressor of mec-8 and unc-52 protein-like 2 [Quillaja saponaria]|uniref:Suppressor of mec-8 and unc-52 protein-like 2 n=1 Tax=Quillaja saponaria TaxID=32244 RepID=A0AAD7PHL0_QUISA|nr:suppressor of mec-8 and unc-52 protein-like 2 [Quillaja saponaria]
MSSSKKHHKEKAIRGKEEKEEEPEAPKYRDRAKERREDQNPDYEQAELGFHAVAPPGNVDLRLADAQKLSIEKSKYLGGDVEHTHLVKGLDYALLNKVRSEIDKKPDAGDGIDGKSRASKEDLQVSIRTATAKSVYQWIVKPHQTTVKSNEMFLPGRMSFIYNMEGGYSHDIPTTLHRSKADCPVPEEMVTVSVDGSVLDRIAKIMSYLRLGSSGKVLKKKKKEKNAKGRNSSVGNAYDEEEKLSKVDGGVLKNQTVRESLPPPPPLPKKNHLNLREEQAPTVAREEEDDIFLGDGVDYAIPDKDLSQSPLSEDMEESPRNKEKPSYFAEPDYGPVQPSGLPQEWHETNGYDMMQTQALAGGHPGEWQEYQYAEQLAYPEQYLQQSMQAYDQQGGLNIAQDPRFMTQEEKDRGLGSVFKRDDQRLQHLREKDAREKDPNFISESYSECYPGYQEYNREVVDSDDEGDLSKMDMGGRAKGRLHRWDFETEEEWATYNEQKEAMPKAAFQFGVKMQDGRKTRKQNKDHKLTNELHKINKILAKKKMEKDTNDVGGHHYDDDDVQPGKKLRI